LIPRLRMVAHPGGCPREHQRPRRFRLAYCPKLEKLDLIRVPLSLRSPVHVPFSYLSAAAAISFSSLEVMAPYHDRVEHHVTRSKPGHEGGSPAIALSETRHGAVSPPLHAKARSRVHGGGRAPAPILRDRRDARALCVTCGAEWLRKRLRLLRLVNAGRCAPKWSCNKWLLAMRGIFWLVQRQSQTVLLMRNEKESPPPARTCWSRHGFGGAFSLVRE
jgi:hypothetical protein